MENASVDAIKHPQTIDKYELLSVLRHGVSSTVYKAHDSFEKRDVAIKVFHLRQFSSDFVRVEAEKLFMRQASSASKLNHPYIAAIYDAKISQQQAYIVSEFVQGMPITEFVQEKKLLPIDKVVQLVYKCCTALSYANERGLFHGEIKLGNIMLSGENEIKIVGFGLMDFVASQQVDANSMESLIYTLPNKLQEDNQEQGDIYALGMVMYQLLTGKLPYEAKDIASLLKKIESTSPTDVRSLKPEMPEAIANVVNMAVEKDHALRYLSWKDFSRDLANSEQSVADNNRQIADSAKINLLRELTFFDEFSDLELWEVLAISQWAQFSAGKTLVKEGEFGGSFYILAKGKVNVLKKDKKLSAISKGSCFGEMAYIDKKNALRQASILSISSVMLIKINAHLLEKASVQLQLAFNRAFLKVLARRLADSNAELVGDFVIQDQFD